MLHKLGIMSRAALAPDPTSRTPGSTRTRPDHRCLGGRSLRLDSEACPQSLKALSFGVIPVTGGGVVETNFAVQQN